MLFQIDHCRELFCSNSSCQCSNDRENVFQLIFLEKENDEDFQSSNENLLKDFLSFVQLKIISKILFSSREMTNERNSAWKRFLGEKTFSDYLIERNLH